MYTALYRHSESSKLKVLVGEALDWDVDSGVQVLAATDFVHLEQAISSSCASIPIC